MKNLLPSTKIATLFLANALRARRSTERATKIFKLIPPDVGRPFADVAAAKEMEAPFRAQLDRPATL